MSAADAPKAVVGEGPASRQGWVAPHLATEFPGLGIAWAEVDCRPRRSPEAIRQRLRVLADRFYGAHAIQLRERPIPWAYRVFFRHIGLDPDRSRPPVEQLALERLHDGGFKSEGLPADALTIATVETGVALCAFDAKKLQGSLGIRDSAPGERLPGAPAELPQGTLTIADERTPLALLFGEVADGYEVDKDTRRIAVAAIQVEGVPQIAVDEALWLAATAIEATDSS